MYKKFNHFKTFLPSDGCSEYLPSDANTIANWIFDDVNNPNYLIDKVSGKALTVSSGFDIVNSFTGNAPFCGGTSLNFDQINDFLSLSNADASYLNMHTNDFTIDGWYKAGSLSASNQWIAQKRGAMGFQISISGSSQMNFAFDDGPNYYSQPLIFSANELFYFAATYNRDGNLTVYKNGVQTYAANISASVAVDINESSPFTIGSYTTSGAYPLRGFLSQIRYSTVARTAEELLAYYNSTQ